MRNKFTILLVLLSLAPTLIAQNVDTALLRTCPVPCDLSSPRVVCSWGDYPTEHTGVWTQSGRTPSHAFNTDTSLRCIYTNSRLRVIPKNGNASFTLGNKGFPVAEGIALQYCVDTTVNDLLFIQYAVVEATVLGDTSSVLDIDFELSVRDSSHDSTIARLQPANLPNTTRYQGVDELVVHWKDWSAEAVDLHPFHGQIIYIEAATRHNDTTNHPVCIAYLAPLCANADDILDTVDSCEYRVVDTADCSVRFQLLRCRYQRILSGEDTLLVNLPLPNAFWKIDGTPQSVVDTFCILGTGTHRVDYFTQTSDSNFVNTKSFHIVVDDFCHCYDTVHDTVVENSLPVQRFGSTFASDIDTVIIHPHVHPSCDSIIDYHLKVYWNVSDTTDYYTCNDSLPVIYNGDTLYDEGSRTHFFYGDHGQDSLITFRLHLIPDSDSTLYDTIVDTQLPWTFLDTVFTDSATNFPFHFINEAGCDSTVYYNLHIFWSGDHCDSTLYFPNIVTPNGDGTNDKFVVWGLLENNCFRYNELTIYDRSGRCVYHKVNIANENDWWAPDSHFPVGTYFYYFRAHGVHIHTQQTGVIELLQEK